jgi:chromosome segregation ATPase
MAGHERTPTELRQSLCDTAESTSHLDAERYALEEIRDDLEVRERNLAQHLSSAMRENTELATQVESKRQALDDVEAELDAIARETLALEQRYASNELRLSEMEREASTLDKELGSVRADVSSAGTALDSVHDSIVRIDRKLLFTEEKYAAKLTNAGKPNRPSSGRE